MNKTSSLLNLFFLFSLINIVVVLFKTRIGRMEFKNIKKNSFFIFNIGLLAFIVLLKCFFPFKSLALEPDIFLGSLVLYSILLYFLLFIIRHLRSKWKEYGLAFLSMLAAIFLVEQGLRLWTPQELKPIIDSKCRFIPSKKYHHIFPAHHELYMGKFEGKNVFLRTNQDGLRSRYSREEFLKYKNRLVILGDSFVLGIGVRQKQTLPELIESFLRRQTRSQDIAVLNAGLTSYSPFLENLLFSGVIQYYQPTQVLLFLDETDIGDDIAYSNEFKTKENEGYFDTDWEHDYVYHGALYELSRPLIAYWQRYLEFPWKIFNKNFKRRYNYYHFKIKIDNVVETNRFFIYRHPLEKTKPYFIQTLENIRRIAEKANQIGARFTLVIYPRFQHWSTRECPKNWERRSYGLNDPFKFEYFRFFDENQDQFKFAYLNLLPAFQRTKRFPLVFENDPHWNERGHHFVARIMTRYLLERGL